MESKLPLVGTTIFTVMSALATEHNAINLSQGFPDFQISDLLKQCVDDALKEDQVQYAPMAGRLDLRTKIGSLVSKKHEIHLNPDSEITITAGATQAIFTAIAAVVCAGDEVILFDPAYDCYDPAVVLFGGKPIHLKLTFPDYRIDWNQLEKKITSKTKLIIVNNPHNPCGSVWTKDDLIEFERVVSKHNQLYIISDEVYEYIHFKGSHQSVLKSDLLRSKSFVTYSFGKTLHVTGWKLGYCIAPPTLSSEFRKVHQFNVFCVNNTMQYAVLKYLNTEMALVGISDFYKQKRDLFFDALSSSKFKMLPCDGTYFCLLDYSEIATEQDIDFATRLITEIGVASIPISGFYQDKTDKHILRFCFAKKEETLLLAAKKLCLI